MSPDKILVKCIFDATLIMSMDTISWEVYWKLHPIFMVELNNMIRNIDWTDGV